MRSPNRAIAPPDQQLRDYEYPEQEGAMALADLPNVAA